MARVRRMSHHALEYLGMSELPQRRAYRTDLTDEQWAAIEPFV